MSAVEEKENVVEVLEPSYTAVNVVVGKDEHMHVYTQKPLSFFGKMELFSLLGNAVSEALRSGDVSISDILEARNRDLSRISAKEIKEADELVKAIAVLVEHAPEFMKDLYCIALGIPKSQREYMKEIMELHPDDGGLSDEVGFQILDTFIDQNWEALVDFFGKKIVPLFQKVSQKAQNTPSSKPLSRTQRRTRKQ